MPPLCHHHAISTCAALAVICLASCSRPGGPEPDRGTSRTGRPLPPFTIPPGLTGLAAAPGRLYVTWRGDPTSGDHAIFVANDPALVYAGPPRKTAVAAGVVSIDGLDTNSEYWVGLALFDGTEYRPVGVPLRARTAPVIYVDASSSATSPDGTTPETAFRTIGIGLAAAQFAGGGNVWVRGGVYTMSASEIPHRTMLAGGFDAAFDPSERDPDRTPTTIRTSGGPLFLTSNATIAIDGIVIEGNDQTTIAIDASTTSMQLSRVVIDNCADRGVRLRGDEIQAVRVTIASSTIRRNGGDGLSANGAFDLHCDGSTFAFNVQEGMDLDDLIAPENGSARVELTGCRFVGNGTEGLDVDLAAPAVHGNGTGRLTATVRGCEFVSNLAAGLLIDQDHEFDAGWYSEVVITECTARANGGPGFHVDADAAGDALLANLLATANRGDGVWLSSESNGGFATLTASVLAGNLGAGIRASLGNRPVLASHCVLAGNGSGMASTSVRSTIHSSIAWLQPATFEGVDTSTSTVVDTATTRTFLHAPRAYGSIESTASNRFRIVGFEPQTSEYLEVLADGVARIATPITVDEFSATPALEVSGLQSAAVFADTSVDEDYRLADGSPAREIGLRPFSLPAVDAGIWAAPSASEPGQPQRFARTWFRATTISPDLHAGLGNSATMRITMSAPIDATSITSDRVHVQDELGTVLDVAVRVDGNVLEITRKTPTWVARTVFVAVHRGLRAIDGSEIASPLYFGIQP